MNPHWYYLLIDLACISVPFIASFYPPRPFYKEWKYFIPACSLVAIFFLIWDEIFTEKGYWGFNPEYVLGIYLGQLPIEEVLFFICIPYSCVFTYFALEFLIKKRPTPRQNIALYLILMIISIIFIIISQGRSYTFFTGFFMVLFLFIVRNRRYNMAMDYLAYICIMPFFFASNGILTGSIIGDPIVWYNDAENLGIRMFTIPVEDSLYGLLLILANIELYLFFKRRGEIKKPDL